MKASPRIGKRKVVIALLIVLGAGFALFLLFNKQPNRVAGEAEVKETPFQPQKQKNETSLFPKMEVHRQKSKMPFHSKEVSIQSGKDSAPMVANDTHVIAYGNGEGQVGIERIPVEEDRGPEAFLVDNEGLIHIADNVNERILSFTLEGTLKATISLEGYNINDLMIGASGGYITYDSSKGQLYSFDAKGKHLSSVAMPITSPYRGYFHRVDNQIFFADAALNDVLVATEEDGILRTSDSRINYDGIFGSSGRRFKVDLINDQTFSLRIWGPNSSETPFSARDIDLPGVLSAQFVGETQDGLACVQIEQRKTDEVGIHVFYFDEDCKETRRVELPQISYHIWPVRKIDISPGGDVVQFATGPENAILNVFSIKTEEE